MSTPSDVPPQAKSYKKLAPRILRSPAAPPWRSAWQPAASEMMLKIPRIRQDKQRAHRWLIGAWPDLPAFVRLPVRRKSGKYQGPLQQPKSTCNLTSRLPTHSLLQVGPEQGPSQKWHLPGVAKRCRHRAHVAPTNHQNIYKETSAYLKHELVCPNERKQAFGAQSST
eukprot:1151408-Pelagomonas_calceolata.AAC.2